MNKHFSVKYKILCPAKLTIKPNALGKGRNFVTKLKKVTGTYYIFVIIHAIMEKPIANDPVYMP